MNKKPSQFEGAFFPKAQMIDTKELTKQLTGIVGLYPSFNAGGDLPADSDKQPVVYLSDAHKLLRPEILTALGPNLPVTRPQAYDPAKVYNQYDTVADTDGTWYEAKRANTGQSLILSDYWQPTTALTAWFNRIERGAIAKLVLACSSNPATAPLLDNQQMFPYEGNRSDTINRMPGRFVGWRAFIGGVGTALQLIRAGLQLTGAVDNLPIYIYHSSQDEPIATVLLTGTTAGRSLWADVNRYLYQRVGGYYIIGYYEDDLPTGVFAVGAQRAFSAAGCSSCGGGIDAQLVQARAPYVAFQPIYVMNTTPGVMSWDNVNEIQVGAQSWGLNLVISAKCDATPAILNNQDVLTQSLLYSIACDVLEELSTNDRVNAVAKNLTSQAYIALNGQKEGDKGLKAEREKALVDLKDVLSKISPCTPVRPRPGIGFSSVWG